MPSMGRRIKLWQQVMDGNHDSNFRFSDLRLLLEHQSFECRIRGDHFIYSRSDLPEIINLQPVGSKAKPYQVKQVRAILMRYRFEEE